MKCERPKPNTILVRGLQWTSVIERMFYADTPESRDAWINAIKSVSDTLKRDEALNGSAHADQEMIDVTQLPQALDSSIGWLPMATSSASSNGAYSFHFFCAKITFIK